MRLDCEPAPLLLGFVLGPLMEENLRRAMLISGGDPMIFVNRPISLGPRLAVLLLGAAAEDPQQARGGIPGVGRCASHLSLRWGAHASLRVIQRCTGVSSHGEGPAHLWRRSWS